MGLCWKSGIAAEIISQPNNSIGGSLYEAKIFLDTKGMFAWTLVIILVSMVLEKGIIFLINRIASRTKG